MFLHKQLISTVQTKVSMRDFLISSTMALCCASPSLKTLSITDRSVAVVSEPQRNLKKSRKFIQVFYGSIRVDLHQVYCQKTL